MIDIPELTTERLTLRAYRMGDFDAYADFCATDRAKFVGGPMNRRAAWNEFASDTACWPLRGYGMWAVEHRDTGALAGWTGIVHPMYYDEPELGWLVLDAFEGRGIAFEAAGAARAFAAQHFGLNGLASFITQGNQRSVRLAERLGATLQETRERGHGPFHVYRHPAPESLQ